MAQDRLPAREPDVANSRHQVPGAADPGQRVGDPHAGTGPSARGRHDIVEAEHTSFFWPEVDDLLTYEFSADLMDQLHAGLQSPPAADAPPPPAPFPPVAGAPSVPGPAELTLPAPAGLQPPSLSGPNPFLPGPADQPTMVAPEPGAAHPGAAVPGVVPPMPDLKLSSPIPTDADPTIRSLASSGDAGPRSAAPPPPPPPDGPVAGAGYVPDLVAGSFGAEMAPPPPPQGDGAAGLDGLRGSRLFDPRPEPPDPGAARLKVGNLFEPTDPGGPPQTRRLVRLAGRQSPDEVDVTSARLVSPFDSSGPSVRSLFPSSARDGDRPGRSPFDDDGFGPGGATSELRMGSPAPFGPDTGPHGRLLDGGPLGPPVSLSHSTVVDPASGPPVGASFLAPAPSDAWNSSNPAWTSVSDTVSDLPPRQGQGFLYLEEDENSWGGVPPLMRQAEPATRDKGAMLDSVLDVLDRKRGALLAGALALTAVLGGLLAYGKLSDDGTEASGAFTSSTNTTTASSVGSGTGQAGSGAGESIAGPTTVPGTESTEAPSSAVTEAASTSSTRKRATTSSSTTASTAAPTDPTTVTTQPPSSPTTQPPTTQPPTTRPPTTQPPTTRPPTTQPPTTQPPTTQPPTTQPPTSPTTDPPTTPTTPSTAAPVTPAIATP